MGDVEDKGVLVSVGHLVLHFYDIRQKAPRTLFGISPIFSLAIRAYLRGLGQFFEYVGCC